MRRHPSIPMRLRLDQMRQRAWSVLRLAVKTFRRIDGTHWGSSFAFHALFSLFPSVILLVTIGSFFVDPERAAGAVITYVESYVPLDAERQDRVFDVIGGVIRARGQAGMVAFVLVVWGALRCVATLVRATNRAWGTEADSWWKLPLKGLALLSVTAGTLLLGMVAPILASMGKEWLLPATRLGSWVYTVGGFVLPLLVLFLSLLLFYRLAPHRRTRFGEVWVAALSITVLLQVTQALFVVYLKNFATLNAVYGSFGGVMALLLWTYAAGCAVIFGACLCAARVSGQPQGAPKDGNA